MNDNLKLDDLYELSIDELIDLQEKIKQIIEDKAEAQFTRQYDYWARN